MAWYCFWLFTKTITRQEMSNNRGDGYTPVYVW
jgi:hypothetical protein